MLFTLKTFEIVIIFEKQKPKVNTLMIVWAKQGYISVIHLSFHLFADLSISLELNHDSFYMNTRENPGKIARGGNCFKSIILHPPYFDKNLDQ